MAASTLAEYISELKRRILERRSSREVRLENIYVRGNINMPTVKAVNRRAYVQPNPFAAAVGRPKGGLLVVFQWARRNEIFRLKNSVKNLSQLKLNGFSDH